MKQYYAQVKLTTRDNELVVYVPQPVIEAQDTGHAYSLVSESIGRSVKDKAGYGYFVKNGETGQSWVFIPDLNIGRIEVQIKVKVES
jgi:hypothetical protein